MKKIKQYYRIEFRLTSPLSVGSGENDTTDHDILLDGRGVPYIPGSAIAGVYRSLFSEETADLYFGSLPAESSIIVYDAVMKDIESRNVITRDMVALDDYKISAEGAKFNFQALETGATFVTYMEQSMESSEDVDVLAEIVAAWKEEKIRFGAKTARGYGWTEVLKISRCRFNLNDMVDRQKWLDFDMYEDAVWEDCPEEMGSGFGLKKKLCLDIVLRLRQSGGISIRQYSTDVDKADYKQMTLTKTEEEPKGIPVIPGSSWAGAFRAQMGRLDPSFARGTVLTGLIFGRVKQKADDEGQKSRISFSESRLQDGRWETYTRNAIDRFLGGTIDGALYTEETYFDGITNLHISCDLTGLEESVRVQFSKVISAAILDLDRGYMSVGGLTTVGHGLFRIEEVFVGGEVLDFRNKESEHQYNVLQEMILKGVGM